VPGTHKSNVRGPAGLYNFESHGHLVKQEETKAGDGKQTQPLFRRSDPRGRVTLWAIAAFVRAVVIFTEAVTHGTLPWTMPYDRRSVLYRYSPANSAYAGGRHDMDSDHRAGPAWPLSWYDGLTDAQRAVLEPPYHPRHQRPILGDDGCAYTARTLDAIDGNVPLALTLTADNRRRVLGVVAESCWRYPSGSWRSVAGTGLATIGSSLDARRISSKAHRSLSVRASSRRNDAQALVAFPAPSTP
jgi:hypothetical protein